MSTDLILENFSIFQKICLFASGSYLHSQFHRHADAFQKIRLASNTVPNVLKVAENQKSFLLLVVSQNLGGHQFINLAKTF